MTSEGKIFSSLSIADIKYPDIPNWENFFITSVSRTVVSLITRPTANQLLSTPSTDRPLGLDAKDLMVTQTPARPLPADTPVPGRASADWTTFATGLRHNTRDLMFQNCVGCLLYELMQPVNCLSNCWTALATVLGCQTMDSEFHK